MASDDMYLSTDYLEATSGTWHAEDSPWKAIQVTRMIEQHGLTPTSIAEVGCGAGVVISELAKQPNLSKVHFDGYDISPHAIALAESLDAGENVSFHQADPFSEMSRFDLLLALDVLEHVPDYIGFLEKCQAKAEFKIYHIPLDIHLSSVARNSFIRGRSTLGHLHYFVADSALDTLRATGHEVIDYFYTDGAVALYGEHRSLKRAAANVPRKLAARFNTPLSARLFGGYSLLVLAR